MPLDNHGAGDPVLVSQWAMPGTPSTDLSDVPLVVSPDGEWLAVQDGAAVGVWDLATGARRWELPAPGLDMGWPAALAAAPDGSWLAVGARSLAVWDPVSGSRRWQAEEADLWVDDVVVAPDGKWLVATVEDPDHGAHLFGYDALSGEPRHRWYTTSGGEGPDLLIAPDGRWLATRSEAPGYCGGIWLYDPHSGALKATLYPEDGDHHMSLAAVAPDGSWLAAPGELDGALRVWRLDDLADRHEVVLIPPAGEDDPADTPTVLGAAPDGSWVAATDGSGTVRVHDTADGTLRRELRVGQAGVLTVSPRDGRLIAVEDASFRCWDPETGVATTHRQPRRASIGAVRRCRWLADGRLAVIGEHGVRVYDWPGEGPVAGR